MFLFNLFVGVIIDNFNISKDEIAGIRMLTQEQITWVEIQKLFLKNTPEPLVRPPNNIITNNMWRFVKSYWFDNFVTLCIITNMVIMCCKTYPQDPTAAKIFD